MTATGWEAIANHYNKNATESALLVVREWFHKRNVVAEIGFDNYRYKIVSITEEHYLDETRIYVHLHSMTTNYTTQVSPREVLQTLRATSDTW